MCGIFGWLEEGRVFTEVDLEAARRSITSLVHRGPDHGGEWRDTGVYLGHRRLKIIDLDARADQPFLGPEGRFVLSYNGAIYNYIELRRELETLGEHFLTASDTEVFLSAYRTWGKDAFSRFNGMFAAGIHDRHTGKHILVRDHLGQKPLFYFHHAGKLIYASELRALLQLKEFRWRLNHEKFLEYAATSYYPLDSTPIRGVKKLLPGHFLEFDHGEINIKKYWDSRPGDNEIAISMDQASDEFESLLKESCKLTMRSDVPVGVFLSGGIDSTLVLDACHSQNPKVKSFSVAMGEQDFDESHKADTVIKHLGSSTHQVFNLHRDNIRESLFHFFSSLDEPHGDPGYANSFFLAKSCRKDVTVALAGDGGDELFAGYPPFAGLGPVPLMKAMPAFVSRMLSGAVRGLIPARDKYLGTQFKALAYLQGFPATDATRFPLWLSTCPLDDLQRLSPWADRRFLDPYGQPGSIFGRIEELLAPLGDRSLHQKLLYYYQKVFLPEFVCLHTDRAAMQVGLEVRSPFLSIPLVEFANRLPDALRMQGFKSKRLLKHSLNRLGYPAAIANQGKQGFTFPVARWLKSVLAETMNDLLLELGDGDGLVEPSYIKKLQADHLSGKRNNYRLLFNLMAFQAWRRNYPNVSVN